MKSAQTPVCHPERNEGSLEVRGDSSSFMLLRMTRGNRLMLLAMTGEKSSSWQRHEAGLIETGNSMESHSDWYSQIASNIRLHKDSLSQKNYKRYKLGLLLRVAARVDGFSSTCGECQVFQQEIARLIHDLDNLIQLPKKEARQDYLRTINDIIKHLQRNHGLLTEGQNIGLWTALSIGLGVALGIALGNTAIGVAIGTALGIAIGSALDAKAKKEGRVI